MIKKNYKIIEFKHILIVFLFALAIVSVFSNEISLKCDNTQKLFLGYAFATDDNARTNYASQSGSNNNNSVGNYSDSPQQTVSINLTDLLTDSLYSIYRMFTALALSFIVALVVGIPTGLKHTVAKIVIPIIDILQSIPILGFFPAAVTFFIVLFNGSPLGIELAAIFLIFTSMVWNMIFSVYESVLSIPLELRESSKAFRASRFLLFKRLYLPASTPKLIYNTIMSWAGGWYFLTAAEIISLGSKTYTLPGLGSLLSTSVSSGQYLQALIALGVLVAVILLVDLVFWRPLELYASRFKYEYSSSPTATTKTVRIGITGLLVGRRATFPMVLLSEFFIRQRPRPLIFDQSRQLIETTERYAYTFEQKIFGPIQKWLCKYQRKLRFSKSITVILLALIVTALTIFRMDIISQSLSNLSHMYISIYLDAKTKTIVSQIPLALLFSFLRLLAAYLITLAWTIPVAIKIARNRKFERLMPFFQTIASIPATALFPFMVILVNYVPGGLEFPSILLILTGMQWYVLFNLIGGVRSVSGDLEEVAKAFRADRSQYLKRILFPSIYPSFITGSITGWGGGWNSLIVAEYIVFGNKTYSVLGMGSLLDRSAYELGNTVLILLIVGIMAAVIVTINRLIWRRLYKKVIEKYSMSG